MVVVVEGSLWLAEKHLDKAAVAWRERGHRVEGEKREKCIRLLLG